MSVLFCHDHRFLVGENGGIYSTGQYTAATVARYERIFGDLYIAGRARAISSEVNAANRVFADSSRFVPMNDLSNARALLTRSPAARSQLEAAMHDVDVVIVRLPSEIGLVAGAVARRLGKPLITEVVASVRDGLLSHGRPVARLYAPIAEWRMRRAVAASRWTLYVTRAFLQDRYPSSGVQVVASNVQLPAPAGEVLERRMARIAAARSPVTYGMVASIFHDEKRVDVAIRALRRVQEAGVDAALRVVGPGDPVALTALARQLGVGDSVTFPGPLPHGDPLFAFLDDVDVYVQTSFQEGLPRAMIEAMSRGLPALGSNVGGTSELLDGEWLHARGDDARLGAQMRTLSEPSRRMQPAMDNFERAAEFSADRLDGRRAAFWRRFCTAHGLEPAEPSP